MKRMLLCLVLAAMLLTGAVAEDTKEDGVFDLLLIGTDAHDDSDTGRSDVMVLVHLDGQREKVRLISFLRDLYVTIPGHGKNRLNAAYVYGGAELLERTLEENFGVSPDACAEVNFARLTEVIDAIGGVEADVDEAERQQLNGILRHYNRAVGDAETTGLVAKAGLQLLNGRQALCYSRIRKIDDDFHRSSRQREVLEAAFRKVTSLDVLSMAALAVNHLDAVSTDLTAGDVIRLIPLALRVKDAAFESMTVPVAGAYEDRKVQGMLVLVPDKSATRQAVEDFLSGT
ncbi:MAG: LCP family protein [Clostridia bacterium]|nr:LCP family protein [Clostridia bacterium]